MRSSHVVCLVFGILFLLISAVAGVVSVSAAVEMPPQEGAGTEGLAALALVPLLLISSVTGTLSGILGSVISAAGRRKRPRRAQGGFLFLTVMNLITIAASLSPVIWLVVRNIGG